MDYLLSVFSISYEGIYSYKLPWKIWNTLNLANLLFIRWIVLFLESSLCEIHAQLHNHMVFRDKILVEFIFYTISKYWVHFSSRVMFSVLYDFLHCSFMKYYIQKDECLRCFVFFLFSMFALVLGLFLY